MRPPATILHALAEARARIFQTTPPRGIGAAANVRTGAKYLRKNLQGPAMMKYYPPRLSMKTLTAMMRAVPNNGLENFNWRAADGTIRTHLVTPEEEQRLKDVEKKKRFGKGPPKKGQGRRATRGKKR